jgi:hypothetical protein
MSLTPIPTTTPTVTPTAHPTPCPSWCRDRKQPAQHHFGPTVTWHWSPQYQLRNPAPLDNDIPVIVRAELFRCDEGDVVGEPSLYLSGETDMELGRDETEIFIGQLRGFVDTMEIMLRQMG